MFLPLAHQRSTFFVPALTCTAALLLSSALGCQNKSSEPDLSDLKGKVSYGIGMDIGSRMKQQGLELQPEALAAGVRDALSGEEPKVSQQEFQQAFMEMQKQQMAEMQGQTQQNDEAASAEAAENLAEAQAFLEENKAKKDVQTTESGLQYIVVEAGEGDVPGPDDTVEVHYKGTLIDGTEFDSSYARGQPATFRVDAVIPGWTEALQMMKPGAKYKLFIPPNLAYGERGAGRKIGPNEALVFEVELLGIKE